LRKRTGVSDCLGKPPFLVLSGFVGLIFSGVFGAFMALPGISDRTHGLMERYGLGATGLSRDGLRLLTHACGLPHGGGSIPRHRSSSSCGRESRASSRGDGGWVEMCAWALKCAPDPVVKSEP
jgi:hypothetical protein